MILIFTDGASRGNPGPGGWGCLLRFEDGSVQEFGAADADTDHNRGAWICTRLLDPLHDKILDPLQSYRGGKHHDTAHILAPPAFGRGDDLDVFQRTAKLRFLLLFGG